MEAQLHLHLFLINWIILIHSPQFYISIVLYINLYFWIIFLSLFEAIFKNFIKMKIIKIEFISKKKMTLNIQKI